MTRRCTYALLLAGILTVGGCSSPEQQSQPPPSSDVPTAEPGTSLGRIGPGEGTAQSSESTPASDAAAAPPAQTAAQERVQAAKAQAAKAQTQAAQSQAAQCSDLSAQIRGEQVAERQAPSTSIDEDIVSATIAKADKRIDQLQQQYDSLGCPDSELPSIHDRVPQLPPAPGALPP
jgi:hypothetical protein